MLFVTSSTLPLFGVKQGTVINFKPAVSYSSVPPASPWTLSLPGSWYSLSWFWKTKPALFSVSKTCTDDNQTPPGLVLWQKRADLTPKNKRRRNKCEGKPHAKWQTGMPRGGRHNFADMSNADTNLHINTGRHILK